MKLALVLTVFDRLEYLPTQLKQIKNQSRQDFDLFICNNSNQNIDHLKEIIPFTVVDYANKYKMYSRVFLIRDHIIPRGYDLILTIDDDEILPPNLIDQCFRQYKPGTIKSFWAFETFSNYWDRRRLRGAQTGDYAGTGGMLTPASFWSLQQIYDAPSQYWIIDDLWICHCILKYTKFDIMPLNVKIEFIPEEGKKATYVKIKPLKTEFHKEYIIPYRRSAAK